MDEDEIKILENVEEKLRVDLEKKLKALQKKIETLFRKEEYDIYEWSGHKQLREVVEPRLVLENKNNLCASMQRHHLIYYYFLILSIKQLFPPLVKKD